MRFDLDPRSGRALVSWTPPTDSLVEITAYNVSYQITGIGDCNNTYRGPEVSVDIDPRDSGLILEDLVPWRKYTVRVAAANVGGFGDVQEGVFISEFVGKHLL